MYLKHLSGVNFSVSVADCLRLISRGPCLYHLVSISSLPLFNLLISETRVAPETFFNVKNVISGKYDLLLTARKLFYRYQQYLEVSRWYIHYLAENHL